MRTFPGGSTKDERENTEERFKDMENGMRRSDICHTFKKERMNDRSYTESDFPGGSDGKASVYNVGDPGWNPGLGKFPGEGNGNPLQDYCLENPMDRGAW